MTSEDGKRLLTEGFQAAKQSENTKAGKPPITKGFQPKAGSQTGPKNVQNGFQPTTSQGDSGPPNQGSGGSEKK